MGIRHPIDFGHAFFGEIILLSGAWSQILGAISVDEARAASEQIVEVSRQRDGAVLGCRRHTFECHRPAPAIPVSLTAITPADHPRLWLS